MFIQTHAYFNGTNYEDVLEFTKGNAYISCKGKQLKLYLRNYKGKMEVNKGDDIIYDKGFYVINKL